MFRERCIEGNLTEVDKMRSSMERANKDSLTTVTVNTGTSGHLLKQRKTRFRTNRKKKETVVLHSVHKQAAYVLTT